jgi:hypothetical protein
MDLCLVVQWEEGACGQIGQSGAMGAQSSVAYSSLAKAEVTTASRG